MRSSLASSAYCRKAARIRNRICNTGSKRARVNALAGSCDVWFKVPESRRPGVAERSKNVTRFSSFETSLYRDLSGRVRTEPVLQSKARAAFDEYGRYRSICCDHVDEIIAAVGAEA